MLPLSRLTLRKTPARYLSQTVLHSRPYVHEEKSLGELLRAAVVMKVSTLRPVVDNAIPLIVWFENLVGTTACNWLLRTTFFDHFCGGESHKEVLEAKARLESVGVRAILDYAAEAEVDNPRAMHAPKEATTSRIYEYDGEDACDANTRLVIESIQTAGRGGIAAVKMTALGKPSTLQHTSHVLDESRRLFRRLVQDSGDSSDGQYLEASVGRDSFLQFVTFMGISEAKADALFSKLDIDKDGSLDYLEWLTFLPPLLLSEAEAQDPTLSIFLDPVKQERALDTEDRQRFANMLARSKEVAQVASEVGATVLIDAEQSYLQPAIDHITLGLQRDFNKDRAVVFNTYQCYRTDALSRLNVDMDRAHREGFKFGAKLVRGAYMVAENARAKKMGYTSPIHTTLEATHKTYDAAIEYMLQDIKNESAVMIASHNQESVAKAVDYMHKHDIPSSRMADHLTFPLGASGYNVFKYLPYGPVREVLPYLIRRAQENSAMLGGAPKERELLYSSLRSRLGLSK